MTTTTSATKVGMGEIAFSDRSSDVIACVGLGSCIGLVGYDKTAQVGGLAHIVLPVGRSTDETSAKFAESAVPLLLNGLVARGALKIRIAVKMAGGAQLATTRSGSAIFEIGERNILAARDVLKKLGIRISGEDVGGKLWKDGQAVHRHRPRRSLVRGLWRESHLGGPQMHKVMVVDDAAFMRMKCRDLLTKAGYEVSEASNGADAVESYKKTNPDAVLLDITMPDMDGLTALKAIKEVDPAAKVTMVTAMGQQNIVLEALKAGATDFVVKPFGAERVLAAVEKMVA